MDVRAPQAGPALPGTGGPSRSAVAGHLLLVTLVTAAMIANAAHAPSHTYSYAQSLQCAAAVGMIESGNYFLPRNQLGNLARKPQLYSWCQVAALKLTGLCEDFVYRLPTVLSALAAAWLVYFIGRRWYGARAALLAACLWAVCVHMGKEVYVALTDMMLAMWIAASMLCADRLLFHRVAPHRRKRYVVGLWATLILGAMTKGWGIANIPFVGLALGLATAVGPGFGAVEAVRGFGGKLALALRLIGRRWRRAMRATHFAWGLLAVVAVLAPVWYAMFAVGGEEFAGIVYFQMFQRITGAGENPPHPSSTPAVLKLLYFALPASVFAIGALVLTGRTPLPSLARRGAWGVFVALLKWAGRVIARWFDRRNPIFVPFCWMLAIVVPFSFTHGSRPDYLLPSFAAVALMGAWAVGEVARCGRAGERPVQVLRHVFAAVPVTIGVLLLAAGPLYLFQDLLPDVVGRNVKLPWAAESLTWNLLGAVSAGGLLLAVAGVWASLRWRMWTVAALAVPGMLAVAFVDRHFISRHARTGDGDKMVAFARAARPIIGADDFAVYRMDHHLIELYLGRFGTLPAGATPDVARQDVWTPEKLRRSDLRWLFVADHGLDRWGRSPDRSEVRPHDLGEVVLSRGPLLTDDWGRLYLIRLRHGPATAPATATAPAAGTGDAE